MARPFQTCDHCGGSRVDARVQPVPVEPLHGSVPDVRALALCDVCRTNEHRAWRLRWREVETV